MRLHDDQTTRRTAIAVVGAHGFVGRAVVAALTRQGIPTVACTTTSPAVRDGQLIPEVARARGVLVVAGRSNPALAERDPDSAAQELAETRELSRLLAESSEDAGTAQRILVASSGGAVYDGNQPPPYAEGSPLDQSSAYARLKLSVEDAFLSCRSPLSERTVLRLSNVYGPGQRVGTGQGVVGHWFQALAQDQTVRLFGNPQTTRDYVYVDDVAAAFVAALQAPSLPAVLNIGSGQPTSLEELLQLVLEVAKAPQHPIERVGDRPFDRRNTWLEISAARAALGWAPATSLRAGLARTWEHVDEPSA
ncbi:NAD-dependent epimerase/dehydratase family protein [uncultured Modestobacter sp.]|uniref:NAD-dependent epimerase/dehydratase family protein n=1 Tax=uncultured Modestobacter sp. TaxID=380048 RepID=UPI00261C0DE9|nr:NAD-dependent epimerase/dehydratase family protein [uncultured Modestobacter sp.]